MARRLESDEAATETVRRIVRREAKKALERLVSGRQPRDVAVHDARKQIKKARAALRLIRESLGERRYRRENAELREAARPLSAIRDAKILVEAFDGLAGDGARSNGSPLRSVRDVLVGHQLRVRRRLFRGKKPLEPSRKTLRSFRRRARRWPVGEASWSALGPGVERVYRAGRKQLARVRGHASDEGLHELRKQTKYLWQQLQILEPISPAALKEMARQAHRLSDHLGEDHDLAVLRARLGRSNGRAPRTALREVSRLIGPARDELRAKAMALGERLYAQRPRQFSKRLRDRWRAWRKRAG
jgi:CHAD domain-containing protein